MCKHQVLKAQNFANKHMGEDGTSQSTNAITELWNTRVVGRKVANKKLGIFGLVPRGFEHKRECFCRVVTPCRAVFFHIGFDIAWQSDQAWWLTTDVEGYSGQNRSTLCVFRYPRE